MSSYKLRLERKKKFKDMKIGYKFLSSIYWQLIKAKFSPKREFHNIIIDNIHLALESGSKEVRYYMYSGEYLYESMQDDFEFYKNNHINKDNMKYTEDTFIGVMVLAREYFDTYNDLEFIKHIDVSNSYFTIKTKFDIDK